MNRDGQLAQTIAEILVIRARMRQDGATTEECDLVIKRALQAAWPSLEGLEDDRRCGDCNDTGALVYRCPGHECCPVSRHLRHGPHTFLRPCSCSEGGRYRRPVMEEGQKVKTRRKFTRWGR